MRSYFLFIIIQYSLYTTVLYARFHIETQIIHHARTMVHFFVSDSWQLFIN